MDEESSYGWVAFPDSDGWSDTGTYARVDNTVYYTVRLTVQDTDVRWFINGLRYDTRPATKKIRKLVRQWTWMRERGEG